MYGTDDLESYIAAICGERAKSYKSPRGNRLLPILRRYQLGKVGPDTQVWLHPNDFPPLQPPVGEAYVVIYNRDHYRSFVQLTVDEVHAVTRLWQSLYRDLGLALCHRDDLRE